MYLYAYVKWMKSKYIWKDIYTVKGASLMYIYAENRKNVSVENGCSLLYKIVCICAYVFYAYM